jgi:hypothetical protein
VASLLKTQEIQLGIRNPTLGDPIFSFNVSVFLSTPASCRIQLSISSHRAPHRLRFLAAAPSRLRCVSFTETFTAEQIEPDGLANFGVLIAKHGVKAGASCRVAPSQPALDINFIGLCGRVNLVLNEGWD